MANKLTTEDYDNLVKAAASKKIGKAFGIITADELASASISGPLEMKAALSKLIKHKRNEELNQAAKILLEETIVKWKANGSRVDGIRRWDGAIGILEQVD